MAASEGNLTTASPTLAPHQFAVKHPLLAILLFCTFAFSACKKEPGPGGLAQIRGTIYRQDINNNTGQPVGSVYAYAEQKVYIRYGDHDYFDDDTDTNPNGLYTFNWLRTGQYTIFTYTECPSCPGKKTIKSQTVTINSSDEVVTVPDITVDNW